MRLLSSILLFLCVVFMGSCEVINPEEPVPTFLHIDSFSFRPTSTYVGTRSQKITSVWVYFNGNNIGAFDLPATVPIIAEKSGQLRVVPGVTYSGINDVLTAYPFFVSDTMTLVPAQGQVVSWTPETGYLNDSLLNVLNINFETGLNPFLKFSGDTGLTRVDNPELVFEGKYSGYIYLDNDSSSEIISTTGFAASKESYIELNYKGTLPFEIGLATTSGTFIPQYLFGYKPRSDWNKVYIGLQDFIGAHPDQVYKIIVKVQPGRSATGYVAFDNLKVVTRKP